MSPRTVERYISQCLNTGEIKWEKLGRPLNSFAMHPRVEFVIMETMLEHPDKTLAEIAYDVYEQNWSENAVSSILRYLKRNSFPAKRFVKYSFYYNKAFCFAKLHQFPVCGILSTFYRFKVARIAVQRSEEARILFRSNVCLLDPEMLVFLDESGFVRFQLLFYNLFYCSMIFHKSRFFRQLITFLGQKTFSHLWL